jgi:uncharacterized RDD family membrane protein YckC
MTDVSSLVYVGFWRRVLASLIDGFLMAVVTIPVLFLWYGRNLTDLRTSATGFAGLFDFLLQVVFPVVVVVGFWYYKQATPGKMAVGARLVDARTGGKPSLGQCVGRYFAYILSALPLCLGFLWVAFDPRKQGWHDKLARTLVVERPTALSAPAIYPPHPPTQTPQG